MNAIINSQKFIASLAEAILPIELLDMVFRDRDLVCSTCIHGINRRYRVMTRVNFINYQAENAIRMANEKASVVNDKRANHLAIYEHNEATVCVISYDSEPVSGAEIVENKSTPMSATAASTRAVAILESGGQIRYPAMLTQIMVELKYLRSSADLLLECAYTVIRILFRQMNEHVFAQYIWCNIGLRQSMPMYSSYVVAKATELVRRHVKTLTRFN